MPISIKVHYVSEGVQRLIPANPDGLVSEFFAEVKKRDTSNRGEDRETGLLYYGNAEAGKPPLWLKLDQPLRVYSLKNGVSKLAMHCRIALTLVSLCQSRVIL